MIVIKKIFFIYSLLIIIINFPLIDIEFHIYISIFCNILYFLKINKRCNFNQKCINEINDKLFNLGINIGMMKLL